MRAIDQVRRRQRWRRRLDHAATVMVSVLAVVAVVTLLPQSWQQRLVSLGCRGATFGVTDCVASLYEPPTASLRAVPQCDVDQVIEAIAPTVERQVISFPGEAQLERWVGRNGDIRLVALPERPPAGDTAPWLGTPWPHTTLLPGVDLPLGTQWTFLDGEGEREVVAALQQQHALRDQQRSAVAAFLPTQDGRAAAIRPTTWISRTELPAADGEDRAPAPGVVGLEGTDATVLHDELRDELLTTVPSAGLSSDATEALGVVRWARSELGRPTELAGTWAWPQGGATAALHLRLPLAEGDENVFAEWLSAPDGPTLDLAFLRGDRGPDPEAPLERLLSAAGVVAYEEFAGDPVAYVNTVGEQLSRDRRPFGELPAERSVTELVRPQPSGAERVRQEIQC